MYSRIWRARITDLVIFKKKKRLFVVGLNENDNGNHMKEEKGRTERGGLKERKIEAGEMCGDEKYGERLVNIYNYRKRIEEGEEKEEQDGE